MARKPKRTISVFLASPGGLEPERRAFKATIDDLNQGFGEGADVEFEPLGWEDTLSGVGRRIQDVINAEIDRCDVFILLLHRRWGNKPTDSQFSSYTEEEFQRAMGLRKKCPADARKPEIFIFFKRVDAASLGDPGEQLQKVLDFQRQLERSRTNFYRHFEDAPECTNFQREVERHLRAFAKGDLPQVAAAREPVILPLEAVEKVAQAEKAALAAAERAEAVSKQAEAHRKRAEAAELDLAKMAAAAAREGRVEEARQTFGRLLPATADLAVLFLAYEFFDRVGELATAESAIERCLAISGPDTQTADTAAAYCNLGLIYKTRGELDPAELMLRKALAIEEKLGRLEGMASGYGNLGVVYLTRGELDPAEQVLCKALEIDEKLGRLEGMASHYSNLGAAYLTRGDLDLAEQVLHKALAIEEKLGRPEGMARAYGNFGLTHQTRGDLDQAEQLFRKSLAINEKLGRLEGMAIQYGNLGALYEQRGDDAAAREHWRKAVDLFKRVGMPHMVTKTEGLIDGLPKEATSQGAADCPAEVRPSP